MKKLFGIAGISCLAVGVVLVPPVKADTYFNNPTLNSQSGKTYRVSACVTSYRFPGKDQCGSAAMDLIASQFCRMQGYSTDAYWRTRDVGWDNRITAFRWNETYNNGNLTEGFRAQRDNSILFTLITCQ